ncbi:mavicyanin [Punica granatum]|uniref:Phytocyanin domain-containing protein n=2 Tax=Punica granatum TaxID=22663 RepID=A0A218WS85_PUNGR|nr:mavicyanin [Punica granatum]OWM75724.1 hypothetical protein CDL15_Pgr021889 [Punica granatum]PKI54556.1 hypothetical protein CRG98_025070 [Punica granatum]
MTKLLNVTSFSLLVALIGLLALTCKCDATTYMVGDTSGWDISTDLDTWTNDKTFNVGDVLVFQYSTSNSVEEVNKDSFDNCSATNALQTFSNGNTTVPLTRPGPWYFISGNRLYCLGGMKLQVNVESSQANSTAAGAPMAEPGSPSALPGSSSKNNNPSIPASSAFSIQAVAGRKLLLGLVSAFLGLVGPLFSSYRLLHD